MNIASRLESLDQEGAGLSVTPGQCRILIGEATLQCLGRQFVTQRVGEVSLKGKEQRIIVYRVLGRANDDARATSRMAR